MLTVGAAGTSVTLGWRRVGVRSSTRGSVTVEVAECDQQGQSCPASSSREYILWASPTYGLLLATLTMAFGNYFGALTNWVKLQSITAPEDKLFFSVVSSQALRLKLPQDPRFLSEA